MDSKLLILLHITAWLVFFTVGYIYGLALFLFIMSMQFHDIESLIVASPDERNGP